SSALLATIHSPVRAMQLMTNAGNGIQFHFRGSGRIRGAAEMDDNEERRHLAQADRHIAQAKGYVARQRLIVDRLAAKDQPTDDAWATLAALEGTLQAFERHRATILSFLRD